MINSNKFLIHILTLTFILFQVNKTFGQNSAEIYQRISKLKVTGTVLYIAAHPDDENTRLISYLSKEKNYRTGYIALTRGDGGQNLIGSELGVNLGLIRTRELMAARNIDGGEQFFTRAYDFGYSKNPEETFTIWNKEQVLEDLVYVIRKFKPDVLICRFPEDSRAGHGHHSASAILSREAFDIVGDSTKYPAQVKELGTWQPIRLLWNTFNFGSANTTTEDQFKLDVGSYNELLGKSYGEIAADSRSQHKSQGFGVPRQRGKQIEYFTLIKGTPITNDLMEGVISDWSKQTNGNLIETKIDELLKNYKINDPSISVKILLEVRSLITKMQDSPLKQKKINEIDQLILDCAGFWTECYAKEAHYAVGDSINVTLQMIKRSSINIEINGLPNSVKDTLPDGKLNENSLKSFAFIIPGANKISQPYWLEVDHTKGMFVINDKSQTGKPWNDYPVNYSFNVIIDGVSITITRPVIYKHTDPVKGELYDPLTISSAVTANADEKLLLFNSLEPKKLAVRYSYWGSQPDSFNITNSFPENDFFKVTSTINKLNFIKKGSEIEVIYTITPIKINGNNFEISYKVTNSKKNSISVNEMMKINYDHIPPIIWYPDFKTKIKYIDAKVTTNKILYIKGAGDVIPSYLRQLGISVSEVDANAIAELDLSNYKAIVTGIRAYNTDERLPYVQDKLMSFVKKGGILVVQYNTSASSLPKNIGPFPFTIGRGRVTEEDANITITNDKLSIFNYPNKITQKDFEGWIQERGLYFAEKIDSNYVRPFLMNDKNEDPLDGSLIVGKYGNGTYIYSGLSFFREIPAGVTGAIRLFINLFSEPKRE